MSWIFSSRLFYSLIVYYGPFHIYIVKFKKRPTKLWCFTQHRLTPLDQSFEVLRLLSYIQVLCIMTTSWVLVIHWYLIRILSPVPFILPSCNVGAGKLVIDLSPQVWNLCVKQKTQTYKAFCMVFGGSKRLYIQGCGLAREKLHFLKHFVRINLVLKSPLAISNSSLSLRFSSFSLCSFWNKFSSVHFSSVQNYFFVYPHIKETYTGPTYTANLGK